MHLCAPLRSEQHSDIVTIQNRRTTNVVRTKVRYCMKKSKDDVANIEKIVMETCLPGRRMSLRTAHPLLTGPNRRLQADKTSWALSPTWPGNPPIPGSRTQIRVVLQWFGVNKMGVRLRRGQKTVALQKW